MRKYYKSLSYAKGMKAITTIAVNANSEAYNSSLKLFTSNFVLPYWSSHGFHDY